MIKGATSVSAQPTFYQRHEKTIAQGVLVSGLAIFLIGIASMVAGSVTTHSFENIRSRVEEIENARHFPVLIAIAVGESATITGGCLLGLGIGLSYTAHKNHAKLKVEQITLEEAAFDAKQKKWKNLGIVLGLVALFFGGGMLLSSSLILQHSVNVLEKYKEMGKVVHYAKNVMIAFATIGAFSGIAGGALVFVCGGSRALQHLMKKYEKKESNNRVVASQAGEL